jgi:hypothetical protein
MRVPLTGSSYAGKSIIASGQETVNLYAEVNNADPESPVPVTYYPTAGTYLYATSAPANLSAVRGEYRTSIGTAYCVIGNIVYSVSTAGTLSSLGNIANLPSQVYFSDNGLACVLVDGTNGYAIDLITNNKGQITDPNFYGADYVALLDTFFIFNRPGTSQFFITGSNVTYAMLTSSAVSDGTLVGGTGYTNGTYAGVSLTGGTGRNATADITVAGNTVTVVAIDSGGVGYTIGDVLSASSIGAGAGFTYTVTAFSSAFDPLDIAAKSGFSDPIAGIVTVHRELWLIGLLTTEIWIGTGAADFYFQEVQGTYVNHGCGAQYSIATQDVLVFFLQQDLQGDCLVLQGQGYDVTEISTPRIVSEFRTYSTVADAIGFCFQLEDHSYYALVFPTANKGWLYDLTTSAKLGSPYWYEWNSIDAQGNLIRPRANCVMFFNNLNLIGDYANGNILVLDVNTNTDVTSDGVLPIIRIKTFPHLLDDNKRVTYGQFQADIEAGIAKEGDNPQISLSWSDDKGRSYGNPVMQSMGMIGGYETVPTWNRLGMARDRVFKLSWSTDVITALNGAFIDMRPSRS